MQNCGKLNYHVNKPTHSPLQITSRNDKTNTSWDKQFLWPMFTSCSPKNLSLTSFSFSFFLTTKKASYEKIWLPNKMLCMMGNHLMKGTVALFNCSTIALLHSIAVALFNCWTIVLLHCCTTAPLHHCTVAQYCYCTVKLLHHCTFALSNKASSGTIIFVIK